MIQNCPWRINVPWTAGNRHLPTRYLGTVCRIYASDACHPMKRKPAAGGLSAS